MQATATITKSKSDKREYKLVTLANQMRCLMISDNEADKSAASLNLAIGASCDPKEFMGVAHFLEHMLFMGSTKFPSHNEYSSFMSTNSGFDNAYTSDEETNYYFEIKNDSFVEAIERLADFFTGALLK